MSEEIPSAIFKPSVGAQLFAISAPTTYDILLRFEGVSRKWEPQEDITAFELAHNFGFLMPVFAGAHVDVEGRWKAMPEGAKRHWVPVSETGGGK